MFNLTATKFELWVEMFLQIASSFYIISVQCLMCELQAQVQLQRSRVFHFEYVQIQTFRHSPRLKSQTAPNTGVCIFGQKMNDFDLSIKKGQVD